MAKPEKMIYGVLNKTVYAASGPALLRAIAGNVLGSEQPFTMWQLRNWFGDDLAENLVRQNEEDEKDPGGLLRPIPDETGLTLSNLNEDLIEDYAWIENSMREELPQSVLALGGPQSYRSGLGIRVEKLDEFEYLMRQEGIQIVRDDDLIGLIEEYDTSPQRVDEVMEALRGLLQH